MQQKSLSPEDAKIQECLEDIRYRACTPDDIALLGSCIAGRGPDRPKLNQPQFCNVSIITQFKSHRDEFNRLGSEQFAKDTNQELVHFYSIDKFAGEVDNDALRAVKKVVNPRRKTNLTNPALQEQLWALDHYLIDNRHGKLSLCMGMPMMIKYNKATKYCVTNRTEAEVVGWTPRPVDETKNVSQGRTRPNNVVNLHSANNHQLIYTALSRGFMLEGTIIVQGFNDKYLTRGITGDLKQKFRELEIMDEITKLRYKDKCSPKVTEIT